jgi:hypothetical protein
VNETGKIFTGVGSAKSEGTKMHPKQRLVKFATVLLPFLSFAVERRVKNRILPASNRTLPKTEISPSQGKCHANWSL